MRWLRWLTLAVSLLGAPAAPRAAPVAWEIDGAHTQTSFEVQHLAISAYRGEFERTSGTLALDEDRPAASRVEATIDAASVRIRDPAWEARLRSAEFLDVARYPTITFRSTTVARAAIEVQGRDDELGKYQVTGLLTLHGVTRRAVLEVTITPVVRDADGRLRRGVHARAVLNRQDYGIRWSRALEAGPFLSDEVAIDIQAEVVRAAHGEADAAAMR